MNNPTMLYKPGKMLQTDNGPVDYIIVAEEEVSAHLKLGWSLTTLVNVAESAPTREELEEKARELSIRFDGRTSDAKLAANIKAALNGLDKA